MVHFATEGQRESLKTGNEVSQSLLESPEPQINRTELKRKLLSQISMKKISVKGGKMKSVNHSKSFAQIKENMEKRMSLKG
mmetsp:Transcript_15869/g.26757  ORF Transcript_15869/g.26757 Transcript_15869/m.26757 type:complete len:81 (+) Transcript_15869:371-613(+)